MEKLTYEEFRDLVWDSYISEKIVSTIYMNENDNFVNNITFDAFLLYLKTDIDVKIFAKMMESFFYTLFKFKGGNENIEDNDKFSCDLVN